MPAMIPNGNFQRNNVCIKIARVPVPSVCLHNNLDATIRGFGRIGLRRQQCRRCRHHHLVFGGTANQSETNYEQKCGSDTREMFWQGQPGSHCLSPESKGCLTPFLHCWLQDGGCPCAIRSTQNLCKQDSKPLLESRLWLTRVCANPTSGSGARCHDRLPRRTVSTPGVSSTVERCA